MSSPETDELFDEPTRSSEPFDWRHYLHVIRERWWILVLCLLLGTVLSGYLISQERTSFVARCVLYIEQQRQEVFERDMTGVVNEEITSIDAINTVVETLNSYTLAQRVAKRLSLATDPVFLSAVEWDEDEKGQMTEESAAGYLGDMVESSYRRMTRLIDIVAQTTDQTLSVNLANTYADEYRRKMLEAKTATTTSASQFLVEEADLLGSKLRVAEEALQSFRERERAASLETMLVEAQTAIDLSTLEIQQVETVLRQLTVDLDAVSITGGDPSQLLLLPSVAADPQLASLGLQTESLQRQLGEVSRRYRPGHPLHIALSQRLATSQSDFAKQGIKVVGQLEVRRKMAENRLQSLEQSRVEAEKRLLEITGKSVEYNSLSRNLEADRALYDSVLSRIKEVDVTSGLTDQPITVRESALGAGQAPSQLKKYLILGVFGGIAVGIGIILGLNYLDPTVRTLEQAEMRSGVGVVAAVPMIKLAPARGGGGSRLPVVEDRRGHTAEAFRTMRATLSTVFAQDKHRVFLITSAVPAEGKTFVSANFAAILAYQNLRTLIIDADLRKPSLSKILFNKNLKPGLSECLLGKISAEEAIVATEVPNLSFLPAGGIAPNPSELLDGTLLEEMIQDLRTKFDRIVIDTSPVLAVRDSLLVAAHADACCLVTRSGYSHAKSVSHAVRLLNESGAPLVGCVLNSLRRGSSAYYAYSYRTYGAYRTYGYGAKGVYGDQPDEDHGKSAKT